MGEAGVLGQRVTRKRDMHLPAQLLSPPWRERLPDGTLGQEYGPPSPAALARHIARFKDWSWRLPSKEARRDADRLIAYVRLEDGSFRAGIPSGELRVYEMVMEAGHSTRYTARHLGLSRSTVTSYLRRLRGRVE